MAMTMALNLKESLCMTKGDGENSYVKNSSYHKTFITRTMSLVDKVAHSLSTNHDVSSNNVFNAADLGCSSSPNTFLVMSTILETISKKCNELKIPTPQFKFYLNDLFSNDYNTLFQNITDFQEKHDQGKLSYFIAAMPGSFYGRLFPRNSLHLVHSSFAVNWMSKIPKFISDKGLPLNKGTIYISEKTPDAVKKSYLSHFEQDFSLFLKCRADEIVPDGVMILTVQGRETEDHPLNCFPVYIHDNLSRAIAKLVSEGFIDEEKFDDFNMPIHTPTEAELRQMVKKEGSFTIEHLEMMAMEFGRTSVWSCPEDLVKVFRACLEPLFSVQFGEEVMEKLYDEVMKILASEWEQRWGFLKGNSFVVVLRRDGHN